MDKTQQQYQAAINSWEVALQFQFYSFKKWVGTRYFYLFFKLAGYLQKQVSSKLIDQMIDELQEIKSVYMTTYWVKRCVTTNNCQTHKVPSSDDLCSIPGAEALNCDLLEGHEIIVITCHTIHSRMQKEKVYIFIVSWRSHLPKYLHLKAEQGLHTGL